MHVATRTVEVRELDGILRKFEEIGDVKESVHALIQGLEETELSAGQKGLLKLMKSYTDVLFKLVDEGLEDFLTVLKPNEDPLARFPLQFPERKHEALGS